MLPATADHSQRMARIRTNIYEFAIRQAGFHPTSRRTDPADPRRPLHGGFLVGCLSALSVGSNYGRGHNITPEFREEERTCKIEDWTGIVEFEMATRWATSRGALSATVELVHASLIAW